MCNPTTQCCVDTSTPASVIPGAPTPTENPNPSPEAVQQAGDVFFIADDLSALQAPPAAPAQPPLSLFQDRSRPSEISVDAFEAGRTYSMAESGHLLPAFVDAYTALAVSGGTPLERIGFQVTRTVTPEGVVGPPRLHIMQMSGPSTEVEVPAAATPRGGAAPGGPAPEPAPNIHTTTAQITAATGQIVAILAIDNYLLRPLVEDGTIPNGARGPLLLSSVLLMNEAIVRTGLIQRTPLRQIGASIPPFVGYQVMAMMLLHYAGVEVGTQANEYGSIVGAAGTALTLHTMGRVAAALPTVEVNGVVQMARGARLLRGLSVAGRGVAGVVGGVTLADLLIGGVVWAGGEMISDDAVAREYRLTGLADDIINNESMGFWPSLFLGNIFRLGRGIGAAASDDFDRDLDGGREQIIGRLAADSDAFGTQVEDVLFNQILSQAGTQFQRHLASHSTTGAQAALTSFRSQINWDSVETGVVTFYRGNRTGIQSHYDFLEEYIGGRAPIGENIRLNITGLGQIRNQGRLRQHLYRRAQARLSAAEQQMNQQAVAWGLAEELPDGRFAIRRPEHLTEAQQTAYRTRIMPQIMEIQRMRLAMQALAPTPRTSPQPSPS